MRQGYGDPDFPAKPGESFMLYLDRYAKELGYLDRNAAPPSDRKVPKRGRLSCMERIDAIFGIKAAERQPGEDA